ncbi:AAA family ATPase [Streptomyces heilongjiangensis]|uniref:AAA family ATPase n=1 Tax=Streptomyces heilongjiangensis TaxID=945052 RepID=A0ABW1BG62_9ACTN|nr:helix-turn-helix transcriptional regulator [Streptomyces heilongjiangensis]MDC2950201.1 helix-turn-helix transcriptional regulator [Streptomyces heilongjiangensis]
MLLERAAALRVVDEAQSAAAVGAGSLVVVTGPVGVGRTALLDELAQRSVARKAAWTLRASGTPSERDFTHGIVTQLFDPLMRQVSAETRGGWFEGAAGTTERLFFGSPPDDSAVVGPAFLDGLRSLVAAICRRRPLLLLVDDLHHADDASLTFLGYLARRLGGLSVTMVVSLPAGLPSSGRGRLRDITDAATRSLTLRPLTPAGTAAAVRHVFGTDGDPRFVQEGHTVTGGLPMLLMPLLTELAAARRTPVAEEATTLLGLRPELLQDRLRQTVLWLPEPLRHCGTSLALLGDRAGPSVVATLAGLDDGDCATAMTALEHLGLLRAEPTTGPTAGGTAVSPPGCARFVHPLLRDAFLEVMPDERYEELHVLAARLLLTHGHGPEAAAEHLLLTAAPVRGALKSTLRAAAGSALGRGSHRTAARYLQRALADTEERPDTAAERSALLSELAAAEARFAPHAADRHLRQALALLETPDERASALARFAPAHWYTDEPALTEILQQIAEDSGHPPGLPRRSLPVWLEARQRSLGVGGKHTMDNLARLTELGPEVPVDGWADRQLAAVLLRSVAAAGLMPRAEVITLAHRILASEEAVSALHTSLPLVASTLVMADEVSGVRAALRHALEWTAPGNDLVTRAAALGVHAWTVLAQGEVTKARAEAEASLALADPQHQTAEPALAALMMVALESRDPALVQRLREEVRSHPTRPYGGRVSPGGFPVLADMLGGVSAELAGEPSTALAIFLRCGRRIQETDGEVAGLQLGWRLRAARQYLRLNETAAARELLMEETGIAESWGAQRFLGRVLRVRARSVGRREAVRLAQESVGILDGSGSRLEWARSLVTLGRLLWEAGDHAQAVVRLRQGHDLAVECGAPWVAEPAAAVLNTLVPARSRGAGRASLTDAQQTVATQAALGLTNREIARELGITSRAVEKHLTAAYRKLGVRKRTDLPSALGSDPSREA